MVTEKIVLYGNLLCPMVPPVRSLLERAGAPYDYVDISLDRAARQRVIEINHGNASVPTLVFPDGGTLTEPKLSELTARLEALGHTVFPETFGQRVLIVLQDPKLLTFGLIFLAIGVLAQQPSLLIAGGILLVVTLLGRLPLWRGKR